MLGIPYQSQNELDKAQEYLTKAVTIDPTFPKGQLDMGRVIYAQGAKIDEASATLPNAEYAKIRKEKVDPCSASQSPIWRTPSRTSRQNRRPAVCSAASTTALRTKQTSSASSRCNKYPETVYTYYKGGGRYPPPLLFPSPQYIMPLTNNDRKLYADLDRAKNTP